MQYKKLAIALLFVLVCCSLNAQTELPATNTTTEQQIEDLTNANEGAETEDDVWLQQLEDLRKHPINLNYATDVELKGLYYLTPLQINSLTRYRNLFGILLSVYELQAIPNWDIETIKKLLPYITITPKTNVYGTLSQRLRGGDKSLVLRTTQILEKSRGYTDSTSSGNFYAGSPQRVFVRYRYSYKNLLQYGFTAEKDPGEQLFKGAQKNGFDFTSVHAYATNIGKLKTIALGDYTVNMGQGLIQWQGLAFRKSADAIAIKRSSNILRPYNSAGEFNFLRGAGATVQLAKNVTATVFGSYRKRDANIVQDSTLFSGEETISSLQTSGFHRTKAELIDKNAITQLGYGANVNVIKKNWQVGLNFVGYQYNKPIFKTSAPYNIFAIQGNNWYNASIDYSYTYKNLHYFGESAIAKNGAYAFTDGLLLSLDPKVDLSVLRRSISKKYQAISALAFTEGTLPTNENGTYTGITLRPIQAIRIDAYSDFYQFPFLKFGVDAPSKGNDYLLQIDYKPNKVLDVYVRYRTETKDQNLSGQNLPTRPVIGINRQNIRANVSYKVSPNLIIKQRVEIVRYNNNTPTASNGYSLYTDINYKPMLKPLTANVRLQYFETDDYNSRIYAYENDVLYSFSIPAVYDNGYRYYVNLNYDCTKKLSLWLRAAQTHYITKNVIGSGLDEIKGRNRTEVKVQMRYLF